MTDPSPDAARSPDDQADQPAVPPTPARRPRVWTVFAAVFLGLVLAVLFQAALGAVLAMIELSRGTDRSQLQQSLLDKLATPSMFMVMAAVGQLGIAIATLIAVLGSSEPFRQRVAWLKPRPSWRVYPIAMLGSIFPLAIGLAFATAVAKVVPADESLAKLFDAFTIGSGIVFVLFIGVVPGLVEELLYRGYVQQRLVKRWGAVAGIAVTTVLFALVHITPHAIVAVLPLGLWFGYIAWRSQSILPTILCHFFVNSGLNAWRMVIKFGQPSESAQTALSVCAVVVGVICFAICCWPGFWPDRPEPSAEQSIA